MAEGPQLYGVSAEFTSSHALLAAASKMRALDVGVVDALSPLPIPGMDAAIAMRGPSLGLIAWCGTLLGGIGCFGMIVFATVVSYPFNIAGRPLFSWPYYVIPSLAAAMLTGAVVSMLAMCFLNRLPRLNHPVFNIDGIEGVTQDRMFLIVEARSEQFDPELVEQSSVDLPMPPVRIQRVPR